MPVVTAVSQVKQKHAHPTKEDLIARGFRLWPKGVSGNPKGGPRKPRTIATTLRALSDEPALDDDGHIILKPDGTELTKVELAMRKVFDDAFNGDARALEFIAERMEGKVTQPISVESKTIVIGALPTGVTIEDL
jgi:hypothetical protein